jgi:hypothetical protein
MLARPSGKKWQLGAAYSNYNTASDYSQSNRIQQEKQNHEISKNVYGQWCNDRREPGDWRWLIRRTQHGAQHNACPRRACAD